MNATVESIELKRTKLRHENAAPLARVRSVSPQSEDQKRGQWDIRELRLGCGAMRAGIRVLLKRAGPEACDLKTVLSARRFGSLIRRDNAQRIGLIPPEIDHQRIHPTANMVPARAKGALLTPKARRQG